MDVGSVSGLLHVFVDIFNSYGTQALRPISNKWIQLGVINTFDQLFFNIMYRNHAMVIRRSSISSVLSNYWYFNYLLYC